MQCLKRASVPSVRSVRPAPPHLIRPRRNASTEHGGDHHHAPAEPVNESLGRGFYITLALVPLGLAALKFSHDGGNDADGVVPYLTRVIGDWSAYGDRWTARNALHTTMIEQAAHDRNLFQSTRGSATVELKFPEIFNTGSPYNVPAGHGGANLDTLIAHYEKENREVEERKARALETSRRE